METIGSIEQIVKSVKVEVSNLGSNHNFPEISSLVNLGWTTKTVIPVSENGKPLLLFIMEKTKVDDRNHQAIKIYLFVLLALILLGFYIQATT